MSQLHLVGDVADPVVEEIRHEFEAAKADLQSGIAHAIRVGELLTEAKKQLRHGQWLPWLADNFEFSDRHARRFMTLAQNGHAVSDLGSMREAFAALEPPDDVETAERAVKRLGHLTSSGDEFLRTCRRALTTNDADAAAHAIGLWREFQIFDELLRIADRRDAPG